MGAAEPPGQWLPTTTSERRDAASRVPGCHATAAARMRVAGFSCRGQQPLGIHATTRAGIGVRNRARAGPRAGPPVKQVGSRPTDRAFDAKGPRNLAHPDIETSRCVTIRRKLAAAAGTPIKVKARFLDPRCKQTGDHIAAASLMQICSTGAALRCRIQTQCDAREEIGSAGPRGPPRPRERVETGCAC